MKKTLSLIAIALSMTSAAFAASVEGAPQKIEPKLHLSVYEKANEMAQPKDLNTRDVSRSATNLQLCWVAEGTFKKEVQVVEIFKAPARTSFILAGSGTSTASPDKKTHTLVGTRQVANGTTVHNCWRFDKQDPIGEYTLTLQVDDISFTPVKFNVVK